MTIASTVLASDVAPLQLRAGAADNDSRVSPHPSPSATGRTSAFAPSQVPSLVRFAIAGAYELVRCASRARAAAEPTEWAPNIANRTHRFREKLHFSVDANQDRG
jgi:hypothetical protein